MFKLAIYLLKQVQTNYLTSMAVDPLRFRGLKTDDHMLLLMSINPVSLSVAVAIGSIRVHLTRVIL